MSAECQIASSIGQNSIIPQGTEWADYENGGDDCGEGVGDREGVPDAVKAEEAWKNHQEREEEDDLADKTEENGGADFPDWLEIGGGDNLEAYHPEAYQGGREGVACELHERGVADEGAGNHTGDGEAECPADEGNESGSGGITYWQVLNLAKSSRIFRFWKSCVWIIKDPKKKSQTTLLINYLTTSFC